MKTRRILYNGEQYKIQTKLWWFFWEVHSYISYAKCMDDYDRRVPYLYGTLEQAKSALRKLIDEEPVKEKKPRWKEVCRYNPKQDLPYNKWD